MKQTLQLKLSQHLALTPQLQQSIRLLQMSTLEMNQEIDQFLQNNPLLEREEPGEESSDVSFTPGAGLAASPGQSTTNEESATPASPYEEAGEAPFESGWNVDLPEGRSSRDDDDDADFTEMQVAATSLRGHLNSQLSLNQLSDRDRGMVGFLIEALDEDGYLAQDMEELIDVLAEGKVETGREDLLEELNIALRHLQNFDPPGIGARNVRECLTLQLENLPPSPVREVALVLVLQHLDLLAARDFVKLRKALRCDEDALRAAHALICSLNPRPGAQYAQLDTRYIIPDVIVRKLRSGWTAMLNQDAMPRLRINRIYADILQRNRAGNAPLNGQLQEAKWLIKNVKQRFETILRVSQAIINRQQQFFEHGEVAMRPLTLREIAEPLDLHESTVSRVTTQKFMASPRGIFELKYFFGSHVATDAGGAASSTAIRALIKQMVNSENSKKPLSDAKIAEILGEQGIIVARRTIAKYREGLNIPPVNLRKSL